MTNTLRSLRQFWLIIVVIIVIIIGIFFRVTNIDKKIYWHDEVYTSLRVAGYQSNEVTDTFFNGKIITTQELLKFQKLSLNTPFSQTIKSLNTHPEHPPLYYIILRLWQNICGSSIIINRTLSIIFSLLVFPTIYWLSRELFNDKFVSFITVSLVAISPFQILYAQEAREYSLWILTIILSSLFFVKSIKFDKGIHWISYSLSFSLTFYTSILSIFLPFVNIIYILLMRKNLSKNKLINFVKYTIISFLLFIPWVIIMLINFNVLKDTTQWTKIEKPLIFLANLWGLHFTSLFADIGLPLYHWLSYIFIILVLILIGYSFFFLIRNTEKNIWLYLLLLTLIPTLGLILPDLIFGGVKSSMTRYFIPAYIAIYLTIGYFLGIKIQKKSLRWSIILIVIFTTGIISNNISANSETWWNKPSSYHNPAIAKIINQSENVLLITDNFDINEGNIISISHKLKPDIKLQLFQKETPIKIHKEFNKIYVFNPSPEFITKIETAYKGELTSVYPLLYQLTFN